MTRSRRQCHSDHAGAGYYGGAMDISVQANAFFNQLWFVVSGHCETGVGVAGVDYYGRSKIVDHFGTAVATTDREEGLVIHAADLEAEVVPSRTEGFGASLLQDRRPQRYAVLTDLRQYRGSARPS